MIRSQSPEHPNRSFAGSRSVDAEIERIGAEDIHILMRGVTDDGKMLNIAGDHIAHGARERASEIVTLEPGRQTEQQVMALRQAPSYGNGDRDS